MHNISERLRALCQRFINREMSLEEFQSRIWSALFPDNLENDRFEIIEDIEEILFTKLEINHYEYGVIIAEKLMSLLN